MEKILGKLTYANVMATIAVFIALGGASYAAFKLPKNSVGTKQIKKEAITAAKIRNGAVTGAKIALGSLGTVPSAASASTASSADRATDAVHAVSADSARNAQTLGGKSAQQVAAEAKLSCPAGMTLQLGLCFEPTTRSPRGFAAARSTCAAASRWLPTPEQIIAFQLANLPAPQPEEWSNVIFYKETTEWGYTAHTTSFGWEEGPKTGSESKAFRCVLLPSN